MFPNVCMAEWKHEWSFSGFVLIQALWICPRLANEMLIIIDGPCFLFKNIFSDSSILKLRIYENYVPTDLRQYCHWIAELGKVSCNLPVKIVLKIIYLYIYIYIWGGIFSFIPYIAMCRKYDLRK